MATEHPLTAWRERHGISQSELARRLGKNRTYMSRVELGQRQIGHDLLPRVCRLTGIKPDVLRPDLARAMKRS